MIPPRTVVAAVDFSDGSRTALVFAARLATQFAAALHVLHVEDPLLSAAAQHHGFALSRETRAELETFTKEAWPAANCAPHLHVSSGSPAAEVIIDGAHREKADVIVIGSRGMSGVERLMFGSTAEGVLRRADLSVLVVPPTWTPPLAACADLSGLGPVIAGVDFSPSSVSAAAAGAWLAERLGTSLEVVHVVPASPVLRRWQSHAEETVRQQMDAAHTSLAAVVHDLAATVEVDVRVESGYVPQQLATVAAHGRRSPLLVLGRHPGGGQGPAPGAIAYRTLTLAAVPVLVFLGPP